MANIAMTRPLNPPGPATEGRPASSSALIRVCAHAEVVRIANDPELRKSKVPPGARSAYSRMLREHLQYLERKALLLLRDARNPALPRTLIQP